MHQHVENIQMSQQIDQENEPNSNKTNQSSKQDAKQIPLL
jgi:hypothetical protein